MTGAQVTEIIDRALKMAEFGRPRKVAAEMRESDSRHDGSLNVHEWRDHADLIEMVELRRGRALDVPEVDGVVEIDLIVYGDDGAERIQILGEATARIVGGVVEVSR